jgi:RNA polymerase sigma-70 factor (ECF subfamily)
MKVLKQNMNTDSDSELLKRYLQTGNLEVLGELYNQYIHLVYGVCLKYLNNREDSKDAVNKIFENLILEIPKFEIQNFRSWLYVVTKNYCLMQLRKEKSEKKRFENYSQAVFMESTNILHPIDEAPDSMLEKHLKMCLEKLKEEQQQCIVLFYYEKKCYQEISEKLTIDQKMVKSYIQNGKRNLKICIEQLQKTEHA